LSDRPDNNEEVVPMSYKFDCELPCHLVDPDLFFAESPVDVERAKALCLDCPLRRSCLADALDRREPWGVWGGQLVVSGVVVARKRPRGRPRKSEVVAA
jgi:WhiB family transcriptional regulator, redox-sensing transcriptional regulator